MTETRRLAGELVHGEEAERRRACSSSHSQAGESTFCHAKVFDPLPGIHAESVIFRRRVQQRQNTIRHGFGCLLAGHNSGLAVQRGIDQTAHRVSNGRRAHCVGFNDIQAPALADGGVDQEVRTAKRGVLFLLGELTGKRDMFCQVRLICHLPQLSFHLPVPTMVSLSGANPLLNACSTRLWCEPCDRKCTGRPAVPFGSEDRSVPLGKTLTSRTP